MLAVVNSPTFSSPKIQNDQFTKVLPHQNFVLYGIPCSQWMFHYQYIFDLSVIHNWLCSLLAQI